MNGSMVLMAHWRHLANTIEFVLPLAHLSPQSKRQIDRFSRSCTAAHGRKSLYLQWALLSPKIASSHAGSRPHLIRGSMGPPESSTQTASRSVQLFLHTPP